MHQPNRGCQPPFFPLYPYQRVDNTLVLRYLPTLDMSDTPITPTRERVKDLIEKGLTVLEIAHLLRISPQAVYKHLKRYDLPLPSQREAS